MIVRWTSDTRTFERPRQTGFVPNSLRSLNVAQYELRSVARLTPFAHRLRGHHQDRAKDLLGEVPVLRSAPAADVGPRVQGRDQYPRVNKDSVALERLQLRSSVRPGSDAPQPTLAGPAREQFRGLRAPDRERRHDVVDSNDVLGMSDHGSEIAPAPRYRCPGHVHTRPTNSAQKCDFSLSKYTLRATPAAIFGYILYAENPVYRDFSHASEPHRSA